MKKRPICLLLAVVLVLGLIPAPSVSARAWDSSHRSGPAGFRQPTNPVSVLKPMVSADSSEEYLALCTYYPSYLTIRTDTQCRLWTMPCDDLVCKSSEALELTNEGDLFTVTGLYRNTEDKYWYQVRRNGTVCYLYSPHVTVEEFLSFDIEAEKLQIPGSIAVGSTLSLGGSINSVIIDIEPGCQCDVEGDETSGVSLRIGSKKVRLTSADDGIQTNKEALHTAEVWKKKMNEMK